MGPNGDRSGSTDDNDDRRPVQERVSLHREQGVDERANVDLLCLVLVASLTPADAAQLFEPEMGGRVR